MTDFLQVLNMEAAKKNDKKTKNGRELGQNKQWEKKNVERKEEGIWDSKEKETWKCVRKKGAR